MRKKGTMNMIYELATTQDLQAVYDVVQYTIRTIYPKYYIKGYKK